MNWSPETTPLIRIVVEGAVDRFGGRPVHMNRTRLSSRGITSRPGSSAGGTLASSSSFAGLGKRDDGSERRHDARGQPRCRSRRSRTAPVPASSRLRSAGQGGRARGAPLNPRFTHLGKRKASRWSVAPVPSLSAEEAAERWDCDVETAAEIIFGEDGFLELGLVASLNGNGRIVVIERGLKAAASVEVLNPVGVT